MKRLSLLILILLLLCGCAAQPEPTLPPTEPAPTETEAPTEPPASLYEPGHPLEVLTDGALEVFSLEGRNIQALFSIEEDLLLFCCDDTTELVRLGGNTLYEKASITLDCLINPDSPALQISEKGITYFDPVRGDLVFLDTRLKEVSRVDTPEQLLGQPALSADRKSLYYLTTDSLREYNLETGIDRLVKQMSYSQQAVTALHWNDTVLECCVSGETGNRQQIFLLVSTGELIAKSDVPLDLETESGRFFVRRMDGVYPEKLTGTGSGEILMLHTPDYEAETFPILRQNALVTVTSTADAVLLDYYRLDEGTHPYTLSLPGNLIPRSAAADADAPWVWMLLSDLETSADILCRWNPESSEVADEGVYLGIRRTAQAPDEVGLEVCRELANELSDRHGVQILIGEDAAQVHPWDYTFTAEHHVDVFRRALSRLDEMLSLYPAGMLGSAVTEMGDGTLRICLVRSIEGIADSSSLGSASGVQFWDESTGNTYVVLKIADDMEQHLHHELFHVIESRIFSLSKALDDWEKLNPNGFRYDYSYLHFTTREDHHLIEGETQAFIDLYAMTFPKEDRARVMEYAITEGHETSFTSNIMQAKLRAICVGIRQAYGLKDLAETYLWEQYLDQPIRAREIK